MIKEQARVMESEFFEERNAFCKMEEKDKEINWEVKFDGYSGLYGKYKDRYYDMYYLQIQFDKENLGVQVGVNLSKVEAVEAVLNELVDNIIDADINGAELEEKEESFLLHLQQYNDIGVGEFDDIMKIISKTYKNIELAIDRVGIVQANIKLYFEMHKM